MMEISKSNTGILAKIGTSINIQPLGQRASEKKEQFNKQKGNQQAFNLN